MNDLPKLNVKLLRRIAEHIEFEPKCFHMHDYANVALKSAPNVCRTVGCIAGWAVFLHDFRSDKKRFELATAYVDGRDSEGGCVVNFPLRAQELLGLTDDEAEKMFADWRYANGGRGVREAVGKINACIASRAEGKEWPGLT